MADLRQAALEALNFLDNCDLADSFNPPTSRWGLETREALRAALAAEPQPNRFDYLKLIRADFEERMRAQGENEVALTRLAGHGEYVSPRVQHAWEAEKRKYAAPTAQQPLTDELIDDEWRAACARHITTQEFVRSFARSIVDRANGIGGTNG